MPCNCNKRRRNPTSTSSRKDPKQQAPSKPDPETKATYELQTRSGRVLTFGSALEAKAARVRAGGAGKITRRS